MATLEQIAEAIRRADAAGNAEDVMALGQAYRALQSQGNGAAATANANASVASQRLQGKVADLPSQRPTMMDEIQSFGRGMIEGVPIAGPTLSDWRRGLDANVASLVTGQDADTLKSGYEAADQELAAKTGGARTAGNITGAIASLAPLGATAVGGRLLGTTGTLGQRIATGALSSGAITAADTAARGGDIGDIGTSAGLATIIGGSIPMVGAGIRRAISPSPASASKTASANVLAREGVDLTAGQRTGNQNLMFREAELGGTAAQDFAERQAEQFTAAALQRVGVNAPRATHDVIASAADDIGRAFDDTAARNFIQPDQRMAADLQSAWRRFEGSTNPSTRPPVIQRIIGDIYGRGQGQRMTGEWYKSTRSELGRLSKSQTPELAEAARDLQSALDDAMERTIQQYNPADLGAWQEVRRLYRNLLVVEDAATRAGADSAEGIITPQALRSAAIRHNKRAYARGRNDFTDLADAGVSSMPKLPNSGTPGRIGARMLLPAGSVAGAAVGNQIAPGLTGTLVGGGLGALLPWAVGRAALSRPGRAYLGNQVAAGAGRALVPPSLSALLTTRD